MKLKYSVIIPVYNARGTLNRCVESLLNQLRSDIELILVNDGSGDDCTEICDGYSYTCSQIKCILKKNGGVSSARNVGIAVAEGKYIMFIDSDDHVSSGYFDKIDKALEEYDYDFIAFGATFYKNGTITRVMHNRVIKSTEVSKTIDAVSGLMVNKRICSPCTKVYKRDIIEANHLRFIESISIAEDWNFNIQYTLNIKSICVSNETNYCVILDNESSLSRTEIGDTKRQQIAFSKERIREAVVASQLPEKEKGKIYAALEFGKISQVYTEAKNDYRKGLLKKERRTNTRIRCSDIQREKITCPPYLFCWLVALPVKMRMSRFINYFAEYLVKR